MDEIEEYHIKEDRSCFKMKDEFIIFGGREGDQITRIKKVDNDHV